MISDEPKYLGFQAAPTISLLNIHALKPSQGNTGRIVHELREPVAQRLYWFCCGYDDLNDRDRSGMTPRY